MQDFESLTPDLFLNAVESTRLLTTGEYTQLNSYENRVFDIRLEVTPLSAWPQDRVILKAYRPGRWSLESIMDEHNFTAELAQEGLPVITAAALFNRAKVQKFGDFYISLFPKVRGRMPQEFLEGELQQVGRTLARLHNVGARTKAPHRPSLLSNSLGDGDLEVLEEVCDSEIWPRYRDLIETIFDEMDHRLDPGRFIRIHGDCHRGNLLHTGTEFFFVDFDDFINGPEVQDFWMLTTGFEDKLLDQLAEGYEELREFPWDDLELIPWLQAFRVIHYAAWVTRRWGDPSFKQIFPQFGTPSFWIEECRSLERILEPPQAHD